ncbi:Clavaminate synthase-like protein [Pluteus cervinus]|uniref:Clavaminate synthase-like protein n=1 Tax=Pluteus cervinus TaxID=181527 RepID=A0ACD3AVY6_9AGAR|nr:Clavaminate synthase-like protein [Pluteus cervinus]
MPTALSELAPLSRYELPPESSVDLDYADLAIIDLSRATTPEGREDLAIQVRDAMIQHGFFYVVNHGYTPSQAQRIFDVADVPFAHVSDDEKKVYAGTMKATGSYQGYKLRQYWHIDAGVHDQLEHYNINRDTSKRQHPEALRPYLGDVTAFAEHNHFNVLHPILRLLARGLELPEDTLVDLHGFSAIGETYAPNESSYPRSLEEEEKTKNVWLKGHTDFGTITILYSQPVGGLQILTPNGVWKWVKYIPNALVINAGDAMEFLSGGYYRATIHRVIQPPEDQQNYTRLGVFYFSMTDDNVKLAPLVESPVLQRIGIVRRFDDKDAPTMETWRKGRTSAYGQSNLTSTGGGVESEVINGVVVKHYT